jgi:hypothetical protein
VLLRSLLVLPVLLLPACSSSQDEALPKAEFLERAEAICSGANERLEAEPEPTAPSQVEPYFDALVGIADRTATDLERLAEDQPDAAELDRIFLTPLRGQVDAVQAYLPKAKAALRESEQAFAALPQPELPEVDAAAMEEYGFDACVETARAE